ncbi:MAG: hypothetical protein R8J85_02355 [Mariprofundales bacterium]
MTIDSIRSMQDRSASADAVSTETGGSVTRHASSSTRECAGRKRRLQIVALAAGVLFGGVGNAWASCGSGHCVISSQSSADGGVASGHWLVDLSFTLLTVNKARRGTSRIPAAYVYEEGNSAGNVGGEAPVKEISTTSRLTTLALTYAVSDRWTIGVTQPFVDRQHIHTINPNTATAATLINPLHGFGDLTLRTHYALWRGDDGAMLGGGLAIKLATGDNNIPDQEGLRNDSTLQPGSGSTDYGFTLDGVVPWNHRWWSFGSLTYNLRGKNSVHYDYGNDTLASLGFGWHAGSNHIGLTDNRAFDLTLQANYRHAPRDKGLITPTVVGSRPSTGGNFLYLTPSLQLTRDHDLGYYSFVQIPIYQKVNDQQLTSRYSIRIGLSQRF